MQQITEISSVANQLLRIRHADGFDITVTLRYSPTQQLWFMDVESGDFIARGLAVTTSPNMLRNYQNIIEFGIQILIEDGSDPYFIDDFSNGRAQFNVLTSVEVETLEERIY